MEYLSNHAFKGVAMKKLLLALSIGLLLNISCQTCAESKANTEDQLDTFITQFKLNKEKLSAQISKVQFTITINRENIFDTQSWQHVVDTIVKILEQIKYQAQVDNPKFLEETVQSVAGCCKKTQGTCGISSSINLSLQKICPMANI